MKNLFKLNLLFSVLVFLFYFHTSSVKALEADLDAGAEIFSNNCAVCHDGGLNNVNPEKTLEKSVLEKFSMNSVSAITTQVTNGKNSMPAFGNKLSDDDINNVANYVLSQSNNGW